MKCGEDSEMGGELIWKERKKPKLFLKKEIGKKNTIKLIEKIKCTEDQTCQKKKSIYGKMFLIRNKLGK